MASAARAASRAFVRSTPATSSFRPAARSARFAIPAQGFRTTARRGYASEAGEGKSSGSGGIWGLAIAVAGGAGAYFYLNGESKPFVPTKEDYQKVYDEIAARLANETDYDDGSYGPVSISIELTDRQKLTSLFRRSSFASPGTPAVPTTRRPAPVEATEPPCDSPRSLTTVPTPV